MNTISEALGPIWHCSWRSWGHAAGARKAGWISWRSVKLVPRLASMQQPIDTRNDSTEHGYLMNHADTMKQEILAANRRNSHI